MKNKILVIIRSFFVIAALFLVTACFGGGDVTVTFDAKGGSAVQAVINKAGETIQVEPTSTRDGYVFDGWFLENAKVSFPYTLDKSVTLEAKWTVETYDVVFHSLGGSSVDSLSYKVTDEEIYLDDPIRPGFAFLGWFPNELLQGQPVLSIPKGSFGDKDFYAKWDVVQYNITYNSNGGTLSSLATTRYNVETATIPLLSPTKTGYSFDGWYDNAQFNGTRIESIVVGSTGHKSLFAKWVPTAYDVNYIVYGGDAIANDTFTIESSALTLPVPSRDGFTFGGWYNNNLFTGDAITSITAGSTGNRTFHAKWNPITYTISYELNGGNFVGDYPQDYTIEDSLDLVNPSRVGFQFMGWYTTAEFTGAPVESIAEGQQGNLSFYAKWETATFDFTISYTLNQGTLAAGFPQGYYEGIGVTLPIPTRAGATFCGWYDTASFTGSAITAISSSDTGNKTLFAKWNLIEYTITYVQNGGSGAVDRTYNVDSGAITLAIPTRSGFAFDGWYTSAEFTGSPVSSLAARSTGNRTFYAKWAADATSYLINYQLLYNGSFSVAPKTSYTAGDATYVLPIPQRQYYVFLGWKLNPELTGDYITQIVSGSTGNIELYAHWAAETYTITYNLNGGTGPATSQYSYKAPNPEYPDPTLNTLLPVPTRSGYLFAGWYADVALTDPAPARPGSGAISTMKAGSSGNRTLYAKWVTTTLSSTVSTFEAENTNLVGKVGAGWSGSASGSNMIVDDAGASAGKYVGWLTNEGSFLEFNIISDRAVSNATLTVAMNMEMIRDQVVLADVTLNNTNYSIMVNGQPFTFSQVLDAGDDPYNLPITNIVLSNVNLLAGTNTILLVNGKNTFWDGRQAGPGVDCIKITSTAQLTWVPIIYS